MLSLHNGSQLSFQILREKRLTYFKVNYRESPDYKAFQEAAGDAEKTEWSSEREATNELDNKYQLFVQRHEKQTDDLTDKIDLEIHDVDRDLKATPPAEVPEPPANAPQPKKKEYQDYLQSKAAHDTKMENLKKEKERLVGEKKKLEDEHKAVVESMLSTKDIALHKATAAIKARERAKQDATEKIQKLLEEKGAELPQEVKDRFNKAMGKTDNFTERTWGGGIDYLEEGRKWGHWEDPTEDQMEEMTKWMVVSASSSKPDFHKDLLDDYVTENNKNGGQSMGFIRETVLKHGGFEGDDAAEAQDIMGKLRVNHGKLGMKVIGMLYGELAGAKEGNRKEVLERFKKRANLFLTMSEKKSLYNLDNEKVLAMFEALDDVDLQKWNDAVAQYESLKKIIGEDKAGQAALATADGIIKECGDDKKMKISKASALESALSGVEMAYKTSVMMSVTNHPKYIESGQLYQYFSVDVKSNPVVAELQSLNKDNEGNKMSLAEYIGRMKAMNAMLENEMYYTDELRTAAATKRDAANAGLQEVQAFNEKVKANEEVLKAKKVEVSPLALDVQPCTESDPAKIREWMEANEKKIADAYAKMKEQEEAVAAATKAGAVRGGGGAPRSAPGGAPTPAPAGGPQKPQQPSGLAAVASRLETEAVEGVVAMHLKERPNDKTDKPLEKEKVPQWTEHWSTQYRPEGEGWLEVRKGDEHVYAHVEKKDDRMKIEIYGEKKKA